MGRRRLKMLAISCDNGGKKLMNLWMKSSKCCLDFYLWDFFCFKMSATWVKWWLIESDSRRPEYCCVIYAFRLEKLISFRDIKSLCVFSTLIALMAHKQRFRPDLLPRVKWGHVQRSSIQLKRKRWRRQLRKAPFYFTPQWTNFHTTLCNFRWDHAAGTVHSR